MSEMVDRVAGALAQKGWYVDENTDLMRLYKGLARAAIEAMRDLPEDPGPRYSAGEYSRSNHEAMIADALTVSGDRKPDAACSLLD